MTVVVTVLREAGAEAWATAVVEVGAAASAGGRPRVRANEWSGGGLGHEFSNS